MAKTMTLRSIVAMFFLALGFQSSFAQTPFWTETFSDEATATANWQNGGTNGGLEVWTWTDDILAGFQDPNLLGFQAPTASTGYFYFNSDGNGPFAHDVTLTGVGNPASTTGKTGVHLRFYSEYIQFTPGAYGQVGVSTNGVDFVYKNVFSGFPAGVIFNGSVDVDLPEADNKAQVWIQFRWVGNYEYHWKVDDVELYEFVAPVHDVTFKVNASLLTVDPGGMRIAGSFNGFSDLLMTNEGNGVWSATVALEEGEEYQYKFKNGPNGWESGQAACGVSDGFGGFNRVVTVGTEDLVLPAVCFNSCTSCILPCDQNPDAIICDNFESYNTTQKLAQQNLAQNPTDSWWTTWSGTLGTTEDGIVSTEQANTPTKSLKIVSTAATGGPQDVVLKLGNKTTGRYELKWKTFIPAGKKGYYNIQNIVPIAAGDWNLDVFFDAANAGHIQIGAGAVLANFTYPNGQWFEVKHIIDLDNNLLTLYVNGQYVIKMAYTKNLGGIDFFGVDNLNQYYIDDVEYVALPPLVYNVDICEAAVDLTLFFGQVTTQTTGIYDNTNATVSATDPTVDCWGEAIPGEDILNTTMWYTFVGDGNQYHIETVPCNATNYITGPGDTQMLIYSGDNCTDLTEVVCNDDLVPNSNDPNWEDWRAGLDIETVAGQNYYMLIDGFDGSVFGGELSVGEYCIEITQVPSVTCADGVVGTYEVASPYLCQGAQLADLITIDPNSYIIPNQGPIFGLAWAITSAPVDPNVFPTTDNGLVGSTGFLATPFAVGYVNSGNPFAYGPYYITPIVLGGGTDNDLTNGATLFDTDPTGGCFFVGESTLMYFLPLTNDIGATATTGNGSVDVTPTGGIGELTGLDDYTYSWSNGATTQDLSGIAAGTYTVTISDPCSLEFVLTVQVTVGTKDPSAVQSLTVSPNPTTGTLTLNLALAAASEVRIEVLNTLGQTIQTLNAGKVSNLNQPVNLTGMAQGSYFLRVTIDGETAIRRVVLQR